MSPVTPDIPRKDVVLFMNRDKPDVLPMHLDNDGSLPGVQAAIATALFRDGKLSLGRAARLAEMNLAVFIQYLSLLNIPAVGGSGEEVQRDMETLDAWHAQD
jgi:predicted HTH domain antitoxin